MINEQDYIKGKICLKDLWNHKNIKDYDKFDIDRYEEIKEIKSVAINSFKNIKVLDSEIDRKKGGIITSEYLKEGFSVGNGVLTFKNINAKIDIIENTGRGINIYIIDTSTGVKEKTIFKGEIIKYILNRSKIKFNYIFVLHINKHYVRENELEIQNLFSCENVKDKISDDIDLELLNISKIIDENLKPKFEMEEKCIKGGKCRGFENCFRVIMKESIFDIDGLTIKNKDKIKYYKNGITSLKMVDKKVDLNDKGKLMLKAHLTNKPYINKIEINKFLDKVKYPIYFLDFETYQEGIPKFKGFNPYMQIPFQYSLHILEKENGKLIHKEFLGQEGEDNTRAFSESLLKDITNLDGVIIAYNMSFEKTIIKNMGEKYLDLKERLEKLNNIFIDLMYPFQKKYYYKKEMNFSHSIKNVLPALCGEKISYNNLKIKNGNMAMNSFANLHKKSEEERKEIRKNLLEYCNLDTLAMVKILEKLKEEAL